MLLDNLREYEEDNISHLNDPLYESEHVPFRSNRRGRISNPYRSYVDDVKCDNYDETKSLKIHICKICLKKLKSGLDVVNRCPRYLNKYNLQSKLTFVRETSELCVHDPAAFAGVCQQQGSSDHVSVCNLPLARHKEYIHTCCLHLLNELGTHVNNGVQCSSRDLAVAAISSNLRSGNSSSSREHHSNVRHNPAIMVDHGNVKLLHKHSSIESTRSHICTTQTNTANSTNRLQTPCSCIDISRIVTSVSESDIRRRLSSSKSKTIPVIPSPTTLAISSRQNSQSSPSSSAESKNSTNSSTQPPSNNRCLLDLHNHIRCCKKSWSPSSSSSNQCLTPRSCCRLNDLSLSCSYLAYEVNSSSLNLAGNSVNNSNLQSNSLYANSPSYSLQTSSYSLQTLSPDCCYNLGSSCTVDDVSIDVCSRLSCYSRINCNNFDELSTNHVISKSINSTVGISTSSTSLDSTRFYNKLTEKPTNLNNSDTPTFAVASKSIPKIYSVDSNWKTENTIILEPLESWSGLKNMNTPKSFLRRGTKSKGSSIFGGVQKFLSSQVVTLLFSVLLLLSALPNVVEGCSSRSTPRPRPSSPTLRPNITFQTYACPPAYAAWYCLNGATCFTVKIGESILYNCECADGYMGQRCEFKDLDGSYLPTREKVLLETASIAGGATLAIVVVFVCFFGYAYRKKEKQHSKEPEGVSPINININGGEAAQWPIEGSYSQKSICTYVTPSGGPCLGVEGGNLKTIAPIPGCTSISIPPVLTKDDVNANNYNNLCPLHRYNYQPSAATSVAAQQHFNDKEAKCVIDGVGQCCGGSSNAYCGGVKYPQLSTPSRVVRTVTTITDMASIYSDPRQEVHQVEVLQQVDVVKVKPCDHELASTTTTNNNNAPYSQGSLWHQQQEAKNNTYSSAPAAFNWRQFTPKSWLFYPKMACETFSKTKRNKYSVFHDEIDKESLAAGDLGTYSPNTTTSPEYQCISKSHLIAQATIPLPNNTYTHVATGAHNMTVPVYCCDGRDGAVRNGCIKEAFGYVNDQKCRGKGTSNPDLEKY